MSGRNCKKNGRSSSLEEEEVQHYYSLHKLRRCTRVGVCIDAGMQRREKEREYWHLFMFKEQFYCWRRDIMMVAMLFLEGNLKILLFLLMKFRLNGFIAPSAF